MGSLHVLAAIFLWSSLGVVVRLSDVAVVTLIFHSLLISIILQGILLFRKNYRRELPDFHKLKYPFILGVVSLINTSTYYYAFKYTTIANAVLTHYTAPIIVAFLAPLFLKEIITRRIILVIIIASIGLWIMLDGLSLKENQMTGIIAGLVSGLSYAVIIIFLRLHSHKFHPLMLSFLTNAFIAILLAPFVREIPLHAIWSFLIVGIVHSTIAPILYYKGLQLVTANRAAVLGYLEPVGAIAFAMLFLDEYPSAISLIGGALIISSGYLTLRR
jgi:drug/metabolite transporter (DMT)-like permease